MNDIARRSLPLVLASVCVCWAGCSDNQQLTKKEGPTFAAASRLLVRLPGWTVQSREVSMALPSGEVARRPVSFYRNPIGMEFIYIPAGTYTIKLRREDGGFNSRQVAIREPFLMGATEVTLGQFRRSGLKRALQLAGANADNHPASCISLDSARAYCKWISERDGLRYRLPTEFEWEYACRAGSKSQHYWGPRSHDDSAWWDGNSGGQPHLVQQKLPNAWGLYDMSGNVFEWCQPYAYARRSQADAARGGGVLLKHYYPVKGGDFGSDAEEISSSFRIGASATAPGLSFGFRVVVVIPRDEPNE
jgi:formylglycine-generating enzyme required for sulfatase activity